jgi:hypothetical protein
VLVSYSVAVSGVYTMAVTIGGVHLKASPYKVTALAGIQEQEVLARRAQKPPIAEKVCLPH